MKILRFTVYQIMKIGFGWLCKIESNGLSKVPQTGPLITYSNHTGSVEVPIIFTQLQPRPVTGIAKIESWDNPLFSWLFNMWDIIPIRRGEADLVALKKSLDALKNGYIIGMSPEGTRNKTGQLRRAHPGVVTMALHSGSPLQPIAHWGGENFRSNLFRFRRTRFNINVGPILRINTNGTKVTKEVRQVIVDEMMYQLSKLLPPSYRGYYSDLDQASTNFIEFM